MWSRSPLVIGRDQEVAELTRAIDACRASRGGAVFLVGEPGIGKTRLAMEAAAIAFGNGVRVLRGRGSTIGPIVPFRPLTEALLALFRSGTPPDDPALGPYRPILGRLIPDLQQDGGVAGGDSLIVLGEAVLRLVTVAGRSDGCLLVLEDLQHADAETLAIVEYLTDNLADSPVLLVATIRNGPCAALDMAMSAAQRRTAAVIRLEPLNTADVTTLAASCLDSPPEDIPSAVGAQLAEYSAGIPFVVEELLHQLVTDGVLARGTQGWRVVGQLRPEVPETVLRGVTDRAEQLGAQGSMLMSIAAVVGDRFPLSVLREVTGFDERTLLIHLRAGVDAQLVAPDDQSPDWYAFRHPLTAEALRAGLTPSDRADYSRRAAKAIERLHPTLPGEWCQLVATLHADAGDALGAVVLFAKAGKRALDDGAADSAIKLLSQAKDLVFAEDAEAEVKAEILEGLLYALAEAGQLDQARKLVSDLDALGPDALGPIPRSALHTRLAHVAYLTGQWAEGMAQVEAARAALGENPEEKYTAPIDAVAANLTWHGGGVDRDEAAERIARCALAAAERVGLPAVACDAWQAIGVAVRERDLDASNACFEKARQLAEQHRLPIWRVYSLIRLAGNDWLEHGSAEQLEQAGVESQRIGAVTVGYSVDVILAQHSVLRGDFATAAEMVHQCRRDVIRLKLGPHVRYILMVEATLAAHQGKRADMERVLTEFAQWGGEQSDELPLAIGLARTFCALLEEDGGLARQELARALDSVGDRPSTFHLAGRHGLHVLLSVLDGQAGWAEYEQIARTTPGKMRWNRQFLGLSRAVLLGRDGRVDEATEAVSQAQHDAAPYAMASHLGMRLVAEAAIEGGWGEPVPWLRRAEEYFHTMSLPLVAGACRSLLRHAGAPVKQRRTGIEQVPDDLRAIGVTVREHEVLQLLVERLTNKAIATRLHISPRTVEKHVASLMLKAEVADRMELSDFAASAYDRTSG